MKNSNRRFLLSLVGGILLITAGVIFLLDNLGRITIQWEMVIGPMLAGGGLIFLLIFFTDTDEWWALIPGFILLGVGINIFMGEYLGTPYGRVSGAVFLGFVGLPFFVIYIFNNRHWWALIPGGVLLTMAAVSLVPDTTSLEGALFFLGLALTFGLVYILPKPAGKLRWALYPAGILLLLGFLMTLGATNLLGYVGPLVLLIIGGYVVYRALRK